MKVNLYIQNEAKNGFKGWTKEGLKFLLQYSQVIKKYKKRRNNMEIDYDALIPQGVIFNLKEIQDMNILKKPMATKLIYSGKISTVKIGNKNHIARSELIRFLKANTFPINIAA